jgi:hypothetical protein
MALMNEMETKLISVLIFHLNPMPSRHRIGTYQMMQN